MSLWFLLWFVLAFILIGATVWSTVILMQQKNAWRKYANKKGLVFTPGKFFEPPMLEGIVDGYNVSFFTATQQNPDSRKNRQLTVMQLNANDSFVDGIACGTKEMLPFLQSLSLLTDHDVKVGKWNKEVHIRTRNKKAVDAFLTEERVTALNSILSMPNADILIILDDAEGMFRFETPNPLQDEKKIENLINKLIARVKKLQPSQEETQTLSAMAAEGDPERPPQPAPEASAEPKPEPEANPEETSEKNDKA